MQSNSSDNCVHRYNIETLYFVGPKLQQINTKPMMKDKSKKLFSDLKQFKVQTM